MDAQREKCLIQTRSPEARLPLKTQQEFPGGSMGEGSSVGIAVAQADAVVRVRSLAQALPHALGTAKKKKKKKNADFLSRTLRTYWILKNPFNSTTYLELGRLSKAHLPGAYMECI